MENRISSFASQYLGTNLSFAIFLFIEGKTLPGFQFGVGRLLHIIVEAGNQYLSLGIL